MYAMIKNWARKGFGLLSARSILIVVLIFLGLVFTGCNSAAEVETVMPTETVVESTVENEQVVENPTSTPLPTETWIPTETPEPSPTQIPYREWEWDQWLEFMELLGIPLLQTGYGEFDGLDYTSGYLDYPYRYLSSAEADFAEYEALKNQQLKAMFDANNNGNDWCLWGTVGYMKEFGFAPDSARRPGWWNDLVDKLGNRNFEPHCKELYRYYDVVQDPGLFLFEFGEQYPNEVTEEWFLTGEERSIVQTYFLRMSDQLVRDGYIDRISYKGFGEGEKLWYYPKDRNFTEDELKNIPDSNMCALLANHVAFALEPWGYTGPLYSEEWYLTTLEARNDLNNDIGDYCGDITDLVKDPYFPSLDKNQ